MYWPTTAARIIGVPPPLDECVARIRPSRRGNLFATLADDRLGVWEVRPTVIQAAVVRSRQSVDRWGANADVFWAHDARSLIVLTTTSHLIVYSLLPTGVPAYESVPTTSFPPGGGPGEGGELAGWELRCDGVAFAMGRATAVLPQQHSLVITLQHPPAFLTVPYPIPAHLLTPPGSHFPPAPLDGDTEEQVECELWDMGRAEWLLQGTQVPIPVSLGATRTPALPTAYSLLTDDGRAYVMYATSAVELFKSERRQASGTSSSASSSKLSPLPQPKYSGQLLYPLPAQGDEDVQNGLRSLGLIEDVAAVEDKAIHISVNGKLGFAAIGTASGLVHIHVIPAYPQAPRFSHTLDLKRSARSVSLSVDPGAVTALAWTSDGYALAVGHANGWAVWSMGGRLDGYGVAGDDDEPSADAFMNSVAGLFWAPGNNDLFLLSRLDPQRLYAMPFVKSATTGQHSPDNTRYAFLQMDDRVMVYRGADQPDMSVINPESDVWQHTHVPSVYIATNWPLRYASISSDGCFIAVAGRRGLTHYSAASGRWKLFGHEREERAFTVRGGLLWFHHVLIAAVEVEKKYQIRLYSRDLDLGETNVLHAQSLPSPVLVMTLLENSLLVYTADSMLYHFLILPTRESIRIQLCGSMSFAGLVSVPSRVRALSWLIPEAQKRLGDPADDLIVATIIFLVDGRLVLLRPRKAGNDEVRYDMQVLADRIESYWTHLHGVGTLENSLWGYDGRDMRVWLDALTIEATRVNLEADSYESVQASIVLRFDFYPLSILMDKGIIIGVEYETSTRTLPFALFKLQTNTYLFLPQFLRYHLDAKRLSAALAFAANYQDLVYFGHSLEKLLHAVLEDTVDEIGVDSSSAVSVASSRSGRTLALVASFLDHFPESLDVVVGCARKTEFEHWPILFDVVGKPRDLYERCLRAGALRTAASYLLVMHYLEEADDTPETVRLLRLAMAAKEAQLCKELLRFLHSIDDSGAALRAAIDEVGILKPTRTAQASPDRVRVGPINGSIAPEIGLDLDMRRSSGTRTPTAFSPGPAVSLSSPEQP
ncbi:hypothetical protein CspHIS471_0504050 [Cutaneotrichosporon sp. HIS471]|nr:hypothetical protein CspHIS471_0504050 [Cutaneotrichosporon sp. HIS471]